METSFDSLIFLLSVLAITFFGAAYVWFFKKIEKDSNMKPAESRELNQPCYLLDFYDRSVTCLFCSRYHLFWPFYHLVQA